MRVPTPWWVCCAQDAITGDRRLDGRQQEGISHSIRGWKSRPKSDSLAFRLGLSSCLGDCYLFAVSSQRVEKPEMRVKNNDRGEGKGERRREGRENTNLLFQETRRVKALPSQPCLTLLPPYSLCLQTQSHWVSGLLCKL